MTLERVTVPESFVPREFVTNILRSDEWIPSDDFQPPLAAALEVTVGVNNLLSIAWLNRGVELSSAVGRVLLNKDPEKTGSGFLVGEDLFITNNHVLPNEAIALNSQVQFNYQLNWAGQLERSKVANIKSFERTSVDLDYSLVRVEGAPGAIFGFLDPADFAEVGVNDFVVIIQHPSGGPKQIALMDNKVSSVAGRLFQYTTDTMSGSSGSPVFNTRWQVVGLHHRGGDLQDAAGRVTFANEGIKFGEIVKNTDGLLGLHDRVYALGLGDMRMALLKLLQLGPASGSVKQAASSLLTANPTLENALAVSMARAEPDRSVAVVASGVALGVALIQSLRATSSNGQIVEPAAKIPPGPSPELVEMVDSVLKEQATPGSLYSTVSQSVAAQPAVIQNLLDVAGAMPSVVTAVQGLLLGSFAGAQASAP